MMTMRWLIALGVLVSAPGLVSAVIIGNTQIVGKTEPVSQDGAAAVVVQNVQTAGDTVSGTVVNRAPDPVQNVRLVIDHLWLWDDELHPGDDLYSRLDDYTVAQEIPPGGQIAFTLRPSTPLREGSGGSFMTEVKVASYDVLRQQQGSSPTAGTNRAVEPSPYRIEVPY
jgi:hypothetical protein